MTYREPIDLLQSIRSQQDGQSQDVYVARRKSLLTDGGRSDHSLTGPRPAAVSAL